MKKKKKALREISNKSDISLSLPTTYWQLFKFTYKTNFLLILKISLALAIFCLPLLILLYIRSRITNGLLTEGIISDVMKFRGWFGFVLLIGFLIFSIGVSGALYTMKKHIYNEGVIFKRDFFAGIKKNALPTLGITLFYFGILSILNYFINLFSFQSEIPYYPILLVIFILLSIVLYMMWVISINIIPIYKCSFLMIIKNSFLMTFAKLPWNLLSLLVTITPFIIAWYIGFAPVLYAFVLVYVAIGFGNSVLVVSLINAYIFDELVNKKQFVEAYRRGLFSSSNSPSDEGFNK